MVEERKVPDGYKMTEVGVIPEDWEEMRLGQVLKVRHGKSQHKVEDKNGEYPILATGGQIGWATDYLYNKPSVLIGRKGTIDKPQYVENPFWTIDTLFYTEITKDALPKYIYYYFNTIDWYSYNEASGVPSLNASTIEKICIPLPPLPEQQAIAEALSDVDNLITSLEKLIDKKQKIKQGTMQELLTGRKRLPGFIGEWEVKKVKEFGEVVTGGTPSTVVKEFWNGTIPWVTPTDISNRKEIYDTERKITELGLNRLRKLPADSVLITCIASIGKNAILKIAGACNQQINAIIPNNIFDSDYLYYLFENNKQYLLNNAGITATNIISKKDFSELEFKVPILEEQQAIAQILSDMDAEIEALEQKLEKYKAIKQGMMQELLTGRIRLV
jgi:type I restriction enzyme S subunit